MRRSHQDRHPRGDCHHGRSSLRPAARELGVETICLEAHAPPLQSYSNGARRSALESIVKKQSNGAAEETEDSCLSYDAKTVRYPHRAQGSRIGRAVKPASETDCAESPTITQYFEGEHPQKSPQSTSSEVYRGMVRNRKSKKIIGSSGRTRTYNPSVNSRMLCH